MLSEIASFGRRRLAKGEAAAWSFTINPIANSSIIHLKGNEDFDNFVTLQNDDAMNSMAFQTKLDTNIIQLPDVSAFIGKEVIITIVEIEREVKPRPKTWRYPSLIF